MRAAYPRTISKCLTGFLGLCISLAAFAQAPLTLDGGLHHLRNGNPREWSDFPEIPEAESLRLHFNADVNAGPWTLQLRQQDVKGNWNVRLNGTALGALDIDENDSLRYLEVASGILRAESNLLEVSHADGGRPDDIRVGEVTIHRRPLRQLLAESALAINVTDGDTQQPLPCRLTIVRRDGTLQPLGTESSGPLAVRPGVVYTATGNARVMLPAGNYTVYAGRGFEYSLAHANVSVEPGAMATASLSIRREVPTEGYVACDTHIHTVTHSGHGDCTLAERMVTLAGEGIELPIATDHNVHIDYGPAAEEAGVRTFFTPVIGNEVTTKLGHFNVFPVAADAPPPDFTGAHWDDIFGAIRQTPDVQAIILNHARDIHSGTRPFGPRLRNGASGAHVAGWKLQANAMEIINSGATQTDLLQLTHDWMTQLNHGNSMTPVGSSDSHDVNRYIVGQGRTYIRVNDDDPGNIDVSEAVRHFLQGRVLVSYGLLTEMVVNGTYESGDLVSLSEGEPTLRVALRVLGPHWVEASQIRLYLNGEMIREETIARQESNPTGVLWTGEWKIDRPRHDAHLVAVATGPGISAPYWPMAKPYQPAGPVYEARAFGCSGAVWVDGDGDGRRSSARDYAERLFTKSGGDLAKLLPLLADYDIAVAVQAAHLSLFADGAVDPTMPRNALDEAPPAAREGFNRYIDAGLETAGSTLEE